MLQLNSRMSRVTSYGQLILTLLDFQILVRTFLPPVTVVTLAIFLLQAIKKIPRDSNDTGADPHRVKAQPWSINGPYRTYDWTSKL